MKRVAVLIALASLPLAACDRGTTTDAPTAAAPSGELDAVKAADAALQEAVAAKDLGKIMVHYADQAVLLPAAKPQIRGKAAITEEWELILAIPKLENMSTLTGAAVSSSGDLAYTMGSYRSQMTGEDGTMVTEPGKWVSVWKKQPDGKWRIIIETYNTDIPPPDHK
jgi:ketosteroid isomerase-like protein